MHHTLGAEEVMNMHESYEYLLEYGRNLASEIRDFMVEVEEKATEHGVCMMCNTDLLQHPHKPECLLLRNKVKWELNRSPYGKEPETLSSE